VGCWEPHLIVVDIKTNKTPNVLISRSEEISSLCSLTQNPLFVKLIESFHVILLSMAGVCYCPVLNPYSANVENRVSS
jgi:hypothetical protein